MRLSAQKQQSFRFAILSAKVRSITEELVLAVFLYNEGFVIIPQEDSYWFSEAYPFQLSLGCASIFLRKLLTLHALALLAFIGLFFQATVFGTFGDIDVLVPSYTAFWRILVKYLLSVYWLQGWAGTTTLEATP